LYNTTNIRLQWHPCEEGATYNAQYRVTRSSINTFWQCFEQKATKVYQKTRKMPFGIPLGHKTAKTRSRYFQIHNQSGTSQSVLQCAVQQAQVKTGEPLSFARRSWLEPLAGVFASGGAATTNEPLAFVFANGDACC
jgi:hypothetical protein